MTIKTAFFRGMKGLVKITEAQIDFAIEIDNAFGALFPDFPPYFLESVDAIDRDDPAAFGKFLGLLIIELSTRKVPIALLASRWVELFGQLPDFDLLTQLPPLV